VNKSPKLIHVATSSDVKYNQYEVIFKELGYNITKAPLIANLIEPQLDDKTSKDFELLVAHPLRLAARFISLNKIIPYIIEDTILIIDCFSNPHKTRFGLPGADTKTWWNNLGIEGVLKIMKSEKNRKARFISIIGAYVGGNSYFFEQATLNGEIAKESKISTIAEKQVPYTNPFFFHSIFVPEGSTKTIGEMNKNEFKKIDYRRACAMNLSERLKTYEFISSSQLKFDFK